MVGRGRQRQAGVQGRGLRGWGSVGVCGGRFQELAGEMAGAFEVKIVAIDEG